MKKIFKFIPAALAVFAMASCSNDMLLGENAQQQQDVANKGDLRMSWDAFDNEASGTRAMRDNNFGSLTFENGDRVNVYSDDLYKTDWYTFDTDAFYYDSEGEKMVDNPKFGVMPGENVQKAYIDRETRTTRIDMEIPKVIYYDAASEAKIGDKNMYACNLPAFGYASLNAEGYVEVKNLRYMTAILKINLEKVVSNASYLRIINYGQGATATGTGGEFQHGADAPNSDIKWETAKPMSGIFTAVLSGDPEDRKDVCLQPTDETLKGSWKPYIIVDLRAVPCNTTCIYIPVVAGLDGDVDNIRVEYSKALGDDPEAFLAADWHTIPGMAFPNTEFKQHSRYSGSHAFEFEEMNPYLVSTILNQYQSTSEDIDINITKSFTIDHKNAEIDNVIYLPNFENDVNVNITLGEGFATWTRQTGSKALAIKDLDPEDPFTGTITINTGSVIKAQAAQDAALRVELAEGTAIIAGEFNNAQNLNPVSGNIQLGDGETTTKGFVLSSTGVGNNVKSFTIAKNATWNSDLDCSDPDNLTKTVTVDGTMNADILTSPSKTAGAATNVTVSGMIGNITAAAGDLYTFVNVSGKVTGNIDLRDAVKGKITIISGNPETPDPNEKYVTGNVTMKGDVEVALVAEGEAIGGTLTMTGAGKTLTLTQGYINNIEVAVANAGSWEDKYINVNLNAANEGLAAFLTLTETEGVAKFTESVWDGKKITNTTYADKFTTVGAAATTCIYTASQLASMNGIGGNATLNNNIDLDNQPWAGYAQKGTFAGVKVVAQGVAESARKYPVIKNLNLKKEETTETDYLNGLFTENTADSEVKNITFDGVTAEFGAAKTKGIGAIYGKTTNAAKFDNVIIKGINIKNTKEMRGVGGLVGITSKPITATSCEVAGTIDGYGWLGGFVGNNSSATAVLTFDKCDASGIAFKQTYDSGKAMDLNYARIGGFVGASPFYVEISNSVAPASINYDKAAKMYKSSDDAISGNFYNYQAEQNYIGFSVLAKDNAALTARINGKNYCNHGWDGITSKSHNHGTVKFYYLNTWPAK